MPLPCPILPVLQYRAPVKAKQSNHFLRGRPRPHATGFPGRLADSCRVSW